MQKPKKPKKIARLIIILILFGITTYCKAERVFDGWRVLPIRKEEEYNLGLIGGEGMQHMHGIARSRNNPDFIYLSHDGGQLWRSRNGGQTWEKPLAKGLYLPNGQSIEVDPINPDIVFLVVDQWWGKGKEKFEGLYKSEDGGNSWKQVKNFDPTVNRLYQHNITYNPLNSRIWYVAAPKVGLLRSDDGGDTWSEALGLTDPNIKIIYDIECYGNVIYAGTKKGLYRSNNNGEDITPCGNLPSGSVRSVEINQKEPNMVYVTVYDKGLYRSIDGGNSFVEIKDYKAARVFINPGFPNVIYLMSVYPKMTISHDAGKTWFDDIITLKQTGERMYGWGSNIGGVGQAGLAPNPRDANEAIGFSEARFWKTTDGGHHFKDSSTLFTGYYWNKNGGIVFDPYNKNRFMTFNADVGIKFTDNGGLYFKTRNGTAPNRTRDWYDNGKIYGWHAFAGNFKPARGSDTAIGSVGDWQSRYQIIRTTDAGKNWKLITQSNQATSSCGVTFNSKNPNIVYSGKRISHDEGLTFSDVNFGNYEDGSIVGVAHSNPDILYAAVEYGQILLRSDDIGKTWYKCYSPPWGQPITVWKIKSFKINPQDPNVVYTVSYKYAHNNKSLEGDIVRGKWNGKNISWERLGLLDKVVDSLAGTYLDSLTKIPLKVTKIVIDPLHPQIIYAGIGGLSGVSHIWRSTNSGKNWEDITYNLPRQSVGGMAINPHSGELMIGSFYGTWIFPPPYKSKNLIYDKAVSRPSCHDGLKNGDETGIDSGGSCYKPQ